MNLLLYNTFSNKKEFFKPIKRRQITIYACGVTTYDHIHFGHLRSAVFCDLVYRFLQKIGYQVVFIKNFTDIDDKIIARSQELNCNWRELSKTMINDHDQELQTLSIAEPTKAPLASSYIKQMIAMIKRLIEKGYAYQADGDVFFSVDKYSDYGQLSGKKTDQLIAGYRVEVNDKKKDPLDFALWKKAVSGEPFFESPWGKGRPGWHIECSAIINSLLGKQIDIHIGGSDLIFPHHENELAQSACCNNSKPVNYWLHHAMVRVEGQKMSKSLGNSINVKDLTARYHPELLKFFLLSSHYRKIIDFSHSAIVSSCEALDRLYNALSGYELGKNLAYAETDKEMLDEFLMALSDDFNSPKALGLLFEWVRLINKTKETQRRHQLQSTLIEAGNTINILKDNPKVWFNQQRVFEVQKISDEEIIALVKKRNQARREKNWAVSDEIRDYLQKNKIQLKDNDETSIWQRIN